MNQLDEIRIDKWLFAVRLFKTRGLATEACKRGKIKLNESQAKAAKSIKLGDIINIRQSPMIRSLEVIGLTERRIGAKLVENFAKDITPKEEWDKFYKSKSNRTENQNKSQGRPSKKERRLIDQFMKLGEKK
ncbi:MAG: RNA-binding S4 domain-containing protein [Verrucomicrobiota bacterium]|jgi:ribosome-associated heat shock protein Hsp15|nr:RNA-binding S4 domain-containing protein [Verrucomicrobiota bacterium]|tara:strand:- start:1222 stop:1617 length:396 start_codon:yes stop_codon:yes gene_type:complete